MTPAPAPPQPLSDIALQVAECCTVASPEAPGRGKAAKSAGARARTSPHPRGAWRTVPERPPRASPDRRKACNSPRDRLVPLHFGPSIAMRTPFRKPLLAAALLAGLATLAALGPVAHAAGLTVGANIGNVPWEFEDASGTVVGFEVDLATEVGKRLGEEVSFENIPFQGLFSAVQSGRIDMAVSSITITDERLQSVSFAQPYYDSDQSLTVKADAGIASTKDLSGKPVGVDTGSTGDMWATEHEADTGTSDIRRYEGLAPAMLDLQAGRIDGYISDIPALQYYVKDKPDLKVVERIATGEKYSMMFAKDAELATRVNDVLSTLKEEGFIASLHEKWFGVTPEDTTSTVKVMDMPSAS